MKKIIFYISMLVIFIYWIYIRYYELWTWSFWIDEWYSSIVSYFASLNNFIPYLASGKYDFSQYLFTFFQSISFYSFWISDYSARLPSFVFWIINILIYYLLSIELLKNNKNRYLATFSIMFVFIFSTWQIIWTREARFYELLSFLYLINIYFLWKYTLTNNFRYYLLFFIFALTWILFHPFCFWLILIWLIVLFYNIYKEKNYNKFSLILWFFIIWLIYLLIDIWFKYISSWDIYLSESIPKVNNINNYNYINYLLLYIKNLYNELWIIFITYSIWVIYMLYRKKIYEFLIFWLLVAINILIISYWYMAHTRYMFHLYSIITLIWWYNMFIFWEYLISKYNYRFKKIISVWIILLFTIWIYFTYNLTIVPQRFYYIDYTSPKPNFKMAYNYLNQNYKDSNIISWFPQLCYWYNINNTQKCKYAINVNLIWNKNLINELKELKYENYTNLEFINNLENIKNIENYYFLLDDLTIKNAINKNLIEDIIDKCDLFYKDIWNYESNNLLWIWHCNKKNNN